MRSLDSQPARPRRRSFDRRVGSQRREIGARARARHAEAQLRLRRHAPGMARQPSARDRRDSASAGRPVRPADLCERSRLRLPGRHVLPRQPIAARASSETWSRAPSPGRSRRLTSKPERPLARTCIRSSDRCRAQHRAFECACRALAPVARVPQSSSCASAPAPRRGPARRRRRRRRTRRSRWSGLRDVARDADERAAAPPASSATATSASSRS